MRKIVLLLNMVFCLSFTGCQALSDYADSEIDSRYNALIDCFDQVALYSNSGGSANGIVKRWEEPLHIKITGEYTSEDYDVITRHVETLNELGELPEISIVDKDANFYIFFVPYDDMAATIPYCEQGCTGTVTIYWNAEYEIDEAYVGIANDATTQSVRNNQLLHYITSGLGLINNNDQDLNSIFQSGNTEIKALSSMDYTLIKMLYDPAVKPGMNLTEAEEALRPWLKSGGLLDVGYRVSSN